MGVRTIKRPVKGVALVELQDRAVGIDLQGGRNTAGVDSGILAEDHIAGNIYRYLRSWSQFNR